MIDYLRTIFGEESRNHFNTRLEHRITSEMDIKHGAFPGIGRNVSFLNLFLHPGDFPESRSNSEILCVCRTFRVSCVLTDLHRHSERTL